MPAQAFVCPHCRTWVEGSGRSIRCPSCGRRFSADAARLGATPAREQSATLDYESISSADTRDAAREWGYEAAGADARAEPDQRTPPRQQPQDAGRSGLNLGIVFTIAFIVLFVVGRQFLGPELFIGLIVLLIVGRWLFDRWQGANPPS